MSESMEIFLAVSEWLGIVDIYLYVRIYRNVPCGLRVPRSLSYILVSVRQRESKVSLRFENGSALLICIFMSESMEIFLVVQECLCLAEMCLYLRGYRNIHCGLRLARSC